MIWIRSNWLYPYHVSYDTLKLEPGVVCHPFLISLPLNPAVSFFSKTVNLQSWARSCRDKILSFALPQSQPISRLYSERQQAGFFPLFSGQKRVAQHAQPFSLLSLSLSLFPRVPPSFLSARSKAGTNTPRPAAPLTGKPLCKQAQL